MPSPKRHQCRSCCHFTQRKLSNISVVYRCMALPENPKPVKRYDWACFYWCRRLTPGQKVWHDSKAVEMQEQAARDAGFGRGE